MTVLLVGGFPDSTPKYEEVGISHGFKLVHCPWKIPRTPPGGLAAIVVIAQMCCHSLKNSAMKLWSPQTPIRYVKTRSICSLEVTLAALREELKRPPVENFLHIRKSGKI